MLDENMETIFILYTKIGGVSTQLRHMTENVRINSYHSCKDTLEIRGRGRNYWALEKEASCIPSVPLKLGAYIYNTMVQVNTELKKKLHRVCLALLAREVPRVVFQTFLWC